ncbi:MAG: PAS domain S-box protein [Gammaproteobacteria bacterium]|nr:PAS domain S-box protein [Gammaproteobacteria bacterium]
MAAATLIVTALSIFSLYTAAIDQHRLRLTELAGSQARLIEAIVQLDSRKTGAIDFDAALDVVAAAHSEFTGFGDSGEFALAQRVDDQIVFLIRRDHDDSAGLTSIPYHGDWAEPMQRALEGRSGIMVGLDYRGAEVLAAYEPVAILELGLVAKVDMAEIQAPFLRAAVLALIAAVLVIFTASQLFFRVSRPILAAIDQQAATFLTLAETSLEGIILANKGGEIQFANPAAEKLFGYRKDELLGQKVNCLMPPDRAREHDGYMQRYLQSGIPHIVGTGRQLIAMRKDGSRFPIYLSIGDIDVDHVRLFAGVILDLSEQQQLQREILEVPVREQRRIGQELHDGLGQQLTGLGMLATSLLNKASKPEHELAGKLAAGLQEAIAQVRALSRGLMPVDIETEGFASALQNLVTGVRGHSNISVRLRIHDRIEISDSFTAMHLYRMAQEAINNALKHADADRIEVELGLADRRGYLTISDNGIGILPQAADNGGLGLRIMRQRCGMIDAELDIDSSPEDGTRVQCRFPVDNG